MGPGTREGNYPSTWSTKGWGKARGGLRTAGVQSEGPLGSFQALDRLCPSEVKVGAPLYLSRALGRRTPLESLGSFGMQEDGWQGLAVSPGNWGTTGNDGGRRGRPGPCLLPASCPPRLHSSPFPELGSGPGSTLPPRWKGCAGGGEASEAWPLAPFLNFAAHPHLPAQVFLLKHFLGQREAGAG